MRTLGLLLASMFVFTACAARPLPLLPVARAPLAMAPVTAPASFRTSMNGLLGEEVELSGIYSSERNGALLLLRSGEQLGLRDLAGQPLGFLSGIENRSQVRIRGRVSNLGSSALVPYTLQVRQAVRI